MNYLDRTVQILAYVAVAVIIILSLVPGSARPQTGAPGPGEHVIAYLITAFLFGLRSTSISNLIALGICLVAGAGVLETAQQWVPGRNAQLVDFIASSTGILVGLVAGGTSHHLYRRVLKVFP
jgi:hypothetical protein